MIKTIKVLICLQLIAVALLINIPAFAQKQDKVNPSIGLWESENGSIVQIEGDQGILLETPFEPWKANINKIPVKDIRWKENKWVADEWLITREANKWVEAVWELSDNQIKRFLKVKGKAIETYFTRVAELTAPQFEEASTRRPDSISEESKA